METSDFLQADDLLKVIQVPFAVVANKVSDAEIEAFIGLNSSGRQGRYYRLAAEALKLVETSNNISSLTPSGKAFVALANNAQRLSLIRNILREIPVFSEGIQFLETATPKPTAVELNKWYVTKYPKSEITAQRRFSTFENYLRVTGYL